MTKTRICVVALALLFAVASADAAVIHVSKSYASSQDMGGGVYQTPTMGYARYIASYVSVDLGVTDEIIIEDSSTYNYNDGGDGTFQMQAAGPVNIHAAEGAHPVFNNDSVPQDTEENCILMLLDPSGCTVQGITFTTSKPFNAATYNQSMIMCGNWSSALTAPIIKDCIFISTAGFGCITYASGGVEGIAGTEIDHCAFYFSADTVKEANREVIHWNTGCSGDWEINQCSIVMNNGEYVGTQFPGGGATLVTFTNSIITNVQEWGAYTSPTTNMIDRCFLSYMGSWSGNFPDPDTNIPAGHDGGVYADPMWAGNPAEGDFTIQSASPCAFSGADNIGYDITTVGAAATVPDVGGMSQTDATTALEGAGYVVEVTQEVSETVPAGQIIRTEPAAGSELAAGQTVTLVVSSGGAAMPVAGLLGLVLLGGACGLGGAVRIFRRR